MTTAAPARTSQHPADRLILRPLEQPVSAETHRFALDARRPSEFGGGTCTVLVRRVNNQVELLFHASPQTGAVLTLAQAILIAQALTTAAGNRHSAPDS